jgi:hypothetical protein
VRAALAAGAPRIECDRAVGEVQTARNVGARAPELLERGALVAAEPGLAGALADEWDPVGGAAPYPETLEEAAARYEEALARIAARLPAGRSALVVAHGDTVAQWVAMTQRCSKNDVYSMPHCAAAAGRATGGAAWEDVHLDDEIGVLMMDD